MKKQSTLISMIRIGLVVILLFFFGSQLFQSRITSNVEFSKVEEKITADLDTTLYQKQSNQNIKRYLSIDPAQAQEIVFYRSDNALNANELVLIRFDNEQAAKEFEDALASRQASQMQIYEGYAPEAYALSESALLDFQGNYGIYYVGENPVKVREIFYDSLQEAA